MVPDLLDPNGMDRAQDEVLRMLDVVKQQQRGTAFLDRFWSDSDEWRRTDPAGHRAWAQQGSRPDGQLYPVSVWLEEGRALAARASDATGVPYKLEAFPAAPATALEDRRRGALVSGAAAGAAAVAGLLLALLT